VLRWVLRQDLDTPAQMLDDVGAAVACDVLYGIAQTDRRERSSIFSATAGVLALYNTDAARAAAARPNFDSDEFVASSDTVFITAPAHRQALCAPLVVGLLEQIRHAAYRRAATRPGGLPVFFCLDELANIAPIHDLSALVSEAGGQGLHVLACLRPTAGARERLLAARDRLRKRPGTTDSRRIAANAATTLIDAHQLAEILGVPHTWVLKKARAGQLPHHKLGHYVRFDLDEIIAWLDDTKIQPGGPRRRR